MKSWSNLLFLGCLLLTGCATEQPPVVSSPALPPTQIQLRIVVDNDVNPDSFGEASPVMLRIYQLRETSSFNAADFFALFNNDKAALGGDLLHKNELIVKPGDTKQLDIQSVNDAQSLGLFAAFRQLDNAQWRSTLKLALNQTQTVTVKLSRNQLTIDSPH